MNVLHAFAPRQETKSDVRFTSNSHYSLKTISRKWRWLRKIFHGQSALTLRVFKLYICIFVCFATKAVHLETVTDLFSVAFDAALSRLAPLCHNGNFNILNKSRSQENIGLFSGTSNDFKFNPLGAPHKGGLWEAEVKSFKSPTPIHRGDIILTLEEFNTVPSQRRLKPS